MSPARSQLPPYLLKYASEQHYEKYTAQDHAAWRYILRQNIAFFRDHAVPVYLEGLKKTGIPIDRIPRIAEMDECLSAFGWGAIAVRGFIPPAAFLDFQARAVLPIACDMRTVQHIAYTPAPDIVHEAAGHAPVLADPSYARYLHNYARMAQKAIQSKEDIRLYEAIRYLSDIKENPDTRPQEIARAEERLRAAGQAITHVSENAMVSRMAWWTVEYGLVGPLESPKIFGAGLLSSVGESQTCLSSKVRKIPLSVECAQQSYDITEPQPQLFVARDMAQLSEVLDQFERDLAFRLGGEEALARAQKAESVNTVVLDSGLEASGELKRFYVEDKRVVFLRFAGPVQLSYKERQLPGHGRERHGEGFSGPIGPFKGFGGAPETATDHDLARIGVHLGVRSRLELASGFVVEGVPTETTRRDGKLLLLTWRECTVRRGNEIYFQPAWGEFDQPVGTTVPSVYGGPADMAAYGEINIGAATTNPARTTPFTAPELRAFDYYARLRALRTAKSTDHGEWKRLAEEAAQGAPKEWLLHLELLEVAQQIEKRTGEAPVWQRDVTERLADLRTTGAPVDRELIEKGITLSKTPD